MEGGHCWAHVQRIVFFEVDTQPLRRVILFLCSRQADSAFRIRNALEKSTAATSFFFPPFCVFTSALNPPLAFKRIGVKNNACCGKQWTIQFFVFFLCVILLLNDQHISRGSSIHSRQKKKLPFVIEHANLAFPQKTKLAKKKMVSKAKERRPNRLSIAKRNSEAASVSALTTSERLSATTRSKKKTRKAK